MEVYLSKKELPKLLCEIGDPPDGLYATGNRELLFKKCVAIVGSRTPLPESLEALEYIVPILVKQGYVIVSGCAEGIDAYAHKIALKHKGECIGVLGYGSDTRYPKTSATLIDYLAKNHLIVSEYPSSTSIKKFQFIARNRIIAGLSSMTIIVQAAKKSGSMITAQMALEYNREVFVVPGKPFSLQYEGCNELINDGAQILYQQEQLKKEWTFE